MSIKSLFVASAFAAAALFAGSQIFRVQISEAVFERAVKKNIGRNTAASLGDGLHVYVCGAGSPFPDPVRGGPCLAIVAGDEHVVIDAGSGDVPTLTRMGYPVGKIDAVLLTHLHSCAVQRDYSAGAAKPLSAENPVRRQDQKMAKQKIVKS